MKKFLVFMLVVSMVAFAGCAFAADAGDTVDHPSTNPVDDTAPTSDATSGYTTEQIQQLTTDVTSTYTAETTALGTMASGAVAASIVPTERAIALQNATGGQVISGDVSEPDATETRNSFINFLVRLLAAARKAGQTQPQGKGAAVPPDMNMASRTAGARLSATASRDVYSVKVDFNVAEMKEFSPDHYYFYPQRDNLDISGNGNMKFTYVSADNTTSGDLATKETLASLQNNATVYLVFNYNGNPATGGLGITEYTSDDAVTLMKPIVIATKDSADASYVISIDYTPNTTDTTPTGVGGSGGGCVAGTSALALAVLGLFIAKRRG